MGSGALPPPIPATLSLLPTPPSQSPFIPKLASNPLKRGVSPLSNEGGQIGADPWPFGLCLHLWAINSSRKTEPERLKKGSLFRRLPFSGSKGSLVASSPPPSSPSFRGAHASSIQRHFGAQVPPPCSARQLDSTRTGLGTIGANPGQART